MKATVIGSGSWGTALAQILTDNKIENTIYGIKEDEIEDINLHHRNSKYFGETEINENIKGTTNLEEALQGAEIIVIAIPSGAIAGMVRQIGLLVKNRPVIVNVAKGFNPEKEGQRLSECIQENMPNNGAIVNLIGPSHAEEVIQRYLTAICAVSKDEEAARLIQETFSNEYFRVYTNGDVTGAELGASIKNVLAIASGVASGLGYGDNTRAALITRGLREMREFVTAYGGQEETVYGLTGVGDLIVTCASIHSRNFQAGYAIGQANSAKEFLETNTKTTEGVNTAKYIYKLAKAKGLNMPICEEVYKILYEEAVPSDSIITLMMRGLKAE